MSRSVSRMASLAALALSAAGARAETDVAGVWQGRYDCAQGSTGLTLTIRHAGDTHLHALFHFYAIKSNRDVPEGCFEMSGSYAPANGKVDLSAGRWLLRPPGYVTVDLSGTADSDGRELRGTVDGPLCTSFELRRVARETRITDTNCRPEAVTSSLAGERPQLQSP